MFASVVATVVLVAVVAQTGDVGTHNVFRTDSIRITPVANVTIDGDPGVVAISSLILISPTKPITLLDVRPYSMTPGAELLAVRVMFFGRGVTASGHQMFNGTPAGDCSRSIEGGHGMTYPVEGIRLAKNDAAYLVWYVRSHDVGTEIVAGYRVRYRTERGVTRTVTGDGGRMEIELGPGKSDCIEDVSGWAQPIPGFPA